MGNNRFLEFSVPEIDQITINEVVDCLKSGWLATGPRVLKFENKLKKYFKVPNVLGLTSATSGLFLAMKAMGVGKGDEVITTPMTFVATLNAIVHTGATPVLVDIDLKTKNIDVDEVREAITPNTKVILPVHFAGVPADLDPLYEIAQHYGVRIIEDSAHAIGSEYCGKKIGSFGDTQIFSFHPNKIITSGEGGAVLTRDVKLAEKIKILRFHGIDYTNSDNNYQYDVVEPGYKYNMMDLQAAIGMHQLDHLDEFIQKREKLVDRYQQELTNIPGLELPILPSYPCKVAWCIYTPLITEKAKIDRRQFIELMRKRNVDVRYHYPAIHTYKFYREKFGYKLGQFPKAEKISKEIVSLPLFPRMTYSDQDMVVSAIKEIL